MRFPKEAILYKKKVDIPYNFLQNALVRFYYLSSDIGAKARWRTAIFLLFCKNHKNAHSYSLQLEKYTYYQQKPWYHVKVYQISCKRRL